VWRSSCKNGVPHTLVIEPEVDCSSEDWHVQYLTFKLIGAFYVQVYIGDQKLYQVWEL